MREVVAATDIRVAAGIGIRVVGYVNIVSTTECRFAARLSKIVAFGVEVGSRKAVACCAV